MSIQGIIICSIKEFSHYVLYNNILHHRGTFEKKLEVAVKRVNKGSISEREKDVLMNCDHRNIVKYYCIVSYFYTCLL